jgi:hypothetical protein
MLRTRVALTQSARAALESLRRRVQIERELHQPVILEFVTNQFVGFVCREIVDGQPDLLCSHALVQV